MIADGAGLVQDITACGMAWPPLLRLLRFGPESSLALDISRAASVARLAEHSTQPTCTLQAVLVDDQPRLAVIALQDLQQGSPITINYAEHSHGATSLHAQVSFLSRIPKRDDQRRPIAPRHLTSC